MSANGAKTVRMMSDEETDVGGDTAATGEAQMIMEVESMVDVEGQARMKKKLMDKQREKMENERERVAATNKIKNGVESEITARIRERLQAGKKRRPQLDEKEKDGSEEKSVEGSNSKQQRSNEEEEIMPKRRYRTSKSERKKNK